MNNRSELAINCQEALDKYSRRLSSTGAMRAQYIRYAKEFLLYADGLLDREAVLGYVQRMQEQKLSEGTINFKFRLVRTLFSRSGIEWPFNRGEAPRVTKAKLLKPTYSPELVLKLIHSTKTKGEPEEKAFLALSTTYGLRRTEMVHMGEDDVLTSDHIIHIATAKHGEERDHLIPEEIVPYLNGWDFSRKLSDSFMMAVLYRIEYRAGVNHTFRAGWHSVRRILNTMLRRQVEEHKIELPDVMRFMRWTQEEQKYIMSDTYMADTLIGVDGKITHVASGAVLSDKNIFAVHPFVKFWG